MVNYLTLIKEKEEEEAELYKRMTADSDLLHLKKYVMTDSAKTPRAVPDIVNVTLNKPAVFFANVVSSLGAVKQQVVVESSDKSFDSHYIEEFQDAAFASANDLLKKQGLSSLNVFADVQLCARGRTARRVLFRMEDGLLIPDIAPWDGLNIRYERDKWAANKTYRSRGMIEAEYGIVIKGKEAEVVDVLDTEHNEVWIEGKRIRKNKDGTPRQEEHPYGFLPVVIQTVSLGYGDILLDRDGAVFVGESIFFLIRPIIPELNRLISILQTLNMKAVKPPMKYKSREGKTATPPEYEDGTGMGAITSIDPEGDIAPIDYGDAKRSAEMVYNMMEKAVQEGSYTDVDIGNPQQPFSAIALITIGESKDMVYLPRLAAKELLNISTAEMFTKQVIQIGGNVELGTPGHKRKFSTHKLMGEYETDYKYFQKSPRIDIARMSVANAAAQWYPRRHIYETVLQEEDPKGVEQAWYSELAEKIDPNVLRHRIIMNMLELAEDGDENAAMEAKIMAAGMGLNIAQIKAGITPEAPNPESKPTEPPVPLLGPGGQVGGIMPSSSKRASNLQKTPKEED